MLFPGLQSAADADDESGFVLFQECVFPFFRREIRPAVFELLRSDECDLALQLRHNLKLRIDRAHGALRLAHSGSNVHNGCFQIINRAVLLLDHFLPVPLIDIDGVEIIEDILVASNGIHIRVKALAGIKTVYMQRHALPFCKRLHNLCLSADVRNIKGNRTLVAVEIIIQSGRLLNKQGSGDTEKVQICGQLILKQTLQQTNRFLRVINTQQAAIALGNVGIHSDSSLSVKSRTIS